MQTMQQRQARVLALCVALAAIIAAVAGGLSRADAAGKHGKKPVVRTQAGAVRGSAAGGAYQFLGIPYAAPPTGARRWRAPRRPASWHGLRDATHYAASCPQLPSGF